MNKLTFPTQYAGDPLTEYFTAPWEIRVGLARQLLDAAFLLSGQNELGVALYLTDWFVTQLSQKKKQIY